MTTKSVGYALEHVHTCDTSVTVHYRRSLCYYVVTSVTIRQRRRDYQARLFTTGHFIAPTCPSSLPPPLSTSGHPQYQSERNPPPAGALLNLRPARLVSTLRKSRRLVSTARSRAPSLYMHTCPSEVRPERHTCVCMYILYVYMSMHTHIHTTYIVRAYTHRRIPPPRSALSGLCVLCMCVSVVDSMTFWAGLRGRRRACPYDVPVPVQVCLLSTDKN